MRKSQFSTKYISTIGMFCAISFVAVLIGRLVPNVAGFLSYDPKDAMVVIAGFIFGPLSGVIITVIVAFIEMVSISATGFYGFLMNVISTCAFAVPAAWYYKRTRSHKGAVIGLGVGVAFMTVCMLLWNYIVTPFYMGVPREQVADMLIPIFLPFNLIKGGINAGITLLIYKPIVNALRKAKLVAPSESENKRRFNPGFTAFALAVVISFVLLFLVLVGIL